MSEVNGVSEASAVSNACVREVSEVSERVGECVSNRVSA